MTIRDVLLTLSTDTEGASVDLLLAEPPVTGPHQLSDELFVEYLEDDLGERVLDACEPRASLEYKTYRQYDPAWAVVRREPQRDQASKWDEDGLIRRAVMVSRVVRRSNLSLGYTAVIEHQSGVEEMRIFPSGHQRGVFSAGFAPAPTGARTWWTNADVTAWSVLFEKDRVSALPVRVEHALGYLNWEASFESFAMRLLALCTGLEALVHTERGRSTLQFKARVATLAQHLGVQGLTEAVAANAYDHRSAASHGKRTAPATDALWDVHDLLEEVLRRSISRCISDAGFAAQFADDNSVRAAFPLPP